jgi:sensor histidine kinase regulating citrate/malate metabolism
MPVRHNAAMTRRPDRDSPVARQILLLQVAVVVVLVVTAVALAAWDARRDSRDSAREQATAVARSVADSPFVRSAVTSADPTTVLQPFAEEVRRDTGTDFVVVMDTDRIRFTHPDPERIGGRFVGDVGGAPGGEVFTQEYTGTLGPSVRAVVPVTDGPDVVALVAVGITVDRLDRQLLGDLPGILAAAAAALLAGLGGAWLIARRLRRQTHGLGEREITRMYEYYRAVLGAVREGLLLVDADLCVQLVNDEAARLLALTDDVTGRSLPELGLPPGLVAAVEQRSAVADQTYVMGQQVLVFSTSPAYWGHDEVGAVISVRDRTELQAITGELDLVRGLTESLRAQNHEAANRLHTIVSLVEMGRPEQAVEFATAELQVAQGLTDELVSAVEEPVLAALLLGKTAQAAERGIDLQLEGQLPAELPIEPRDLVALVGNLVDNAFDAVAATRATRPQRVRVALAGDAGSLRIEVDDSGPGIPPEDRDHVLDRGWSSKSREGRGLGLAIVAQVVAAHHGTVEVSDSPLGGARFSLTVAARAEAAPDGAA